MSGRGCSFSWILTGYHGQKYCVTAIIKGTTWRQTLCWTNKPMDSEFIELVKIWPAYEDPRVEMVNEKGEPTGPLARKDP